MQKSRSFRCGKMSENPGRHIHSLIFDQGSDEDEDKEVSPINLNSKNESDHPLESQPTVSVQISPPPPSGDAEAPKAETPPRKPPSDMDMMKERFAKLLLGEDMSGAGNGVSSALALSNAITNLAASVFGEQSKLEPMSAERKARWRKEVDWLLSVADHIVEFVPSKQVAKDGSTMEIMTTRQRFDLLMNIPALKKLDAMLLDTLDNFKENEFWYMSKDANQSEGTQRMSDKWWLPVVKVPPKGLSDEARRWILSQKDNVSQVLKAAQAINSQTISEMEIPENYIDTLPKNGRESLGDFIYKCITLEYFNPEQFLSTMDFSTEHGVVDFKNKIEASVVIWKRKMVSKDAKSSWSSAVSMEKRELLEERAETLLLIIKQRFPGLPQSSLDISKIQYNKDVGQSILESYSRVIESLAFTVLSRIEDVLYADSLTQNPTLAVSSRRYSMDSLPLGDDRSMSPRQDVESTDTTQMTLSDFMGWGGGDLKRTGSAGDLEDYLRETDDDINSPNMRTTKKAGYWKKIEYLTSSRTPNPVDQN